MPQPRQVEGAELVPFGQDHQQVGLPRGVVRVVHPGHAGQQRLTLAPALRVHDAHLCPAPDQRGHDGQRRCIAHVIGVGLEGDAKHRDRLAVEAVIAEIAQFLDHPALDRVVHLDDGFHDALGGREILPDPGQRLRILRETRPAIAGARMQELVADPAIQPDALRHFLDVRADLFAQRRDLVDEGDLGRKKRVGGVFDHLGAFQIGGHDREITQEQRAVNLGHHLGRAVVLHAHHHAVGAHEIVDRGAFAQKFGVRGDVELGIGVCLGHHLGHLPVGAHGHRRFCHDHGIPGQGARNILGRGHHETQIGMAVTAAGGGADGDEYSLRPINGCRQIGGEAQPAGCHVPGHQRVEAGFVDRHFAPVQRLDLAGVLVDADHVMPEIRETDARDKAHIARSDHRDAHCRGSLRHCGCRAFWGEGGPDASGGRARP